MNTTNETRGNQLVKSFTHKGFFAISKHKVFDIVK